MMKNSQFINNLYYNMDGQAEMLGDKSAIIDDPLIVVPENCRGLDKMREFALGNKNVLFKGVPITKAVEKDAADNETVNAYIGAICK